MTRVTVALAVALSACGPPDGPPEADGALVAALVEVHLADARAALDTTGADLGQLGDSLRAVALEAHGLDPDALSARLDALADDPERAQATYDSVEAVLSAERRGPPPDTGVAPLPLQ